VTPRPARSFVARHDSNPTTATAAGAGVATGALVDELATVLGGARHEARFVVDEVLALPPGGARPEVVPPGPAASARAMAARRAAGEPLQYVFGHWPFRGLDLRLDPRVLIPRPETEEVVEVALAEARRLRGDHRAAGLVAVDAGTGSGAIALALATELGTGTLREVWATDTSPDALAVATANLQACRVVGVGAGTLPRVELVLGSWLEPLPARVRGRVDLVVSNPPYVAEAEWPGLPAEVRAEPRSALVAASGRGGEGLADVEAVLEGARRWLGRPGAVVVELAPRQAGPAQRWARQLKYDQVRVDMDLTGRPRALVARLAGSQ
jgi:release factor glutamine methyltransferase